VRERGRERGGMWVYVSVGGWVGGDCRPVFISGQDADD